MKRFCFCDEDDDDTYDDDIPADQGEDGWDSVIVDDD